MTLLQLKTEFLSQLSASYPSEEVHSFFNLLAKAYLGYTRFQVSVHASEKISLVVENQFSEAIKRLKKQEPIQYIIGATEFYGLPFKVTPATLIPRPETEELVAWVLEDFKTKQVHSKTIQVLDIGTGSGCIAIALAKHLEQGHVSAIDISEEALKIANKNAINNKVSVAFFQEDILQLKTFPQPYDVIVSNPPYVRELEKIKMQPNVLDHEPDSALFVSNEDPLLFYRHIAQLAAKHLSLNGTLYFEINEYLSDEMITLVKAAGFANTALRKDIFGRFRMLKCKR